MCRIVARAMYEFRSRFSKRTARLPPAKCTVDMLARIFKLLPETMFLVEEVSGECIGPSGDRFEELAPLLSAVNATSEQIAQAKGEILAKLTSLQSAKRLRDVAVQAFLCVICRDITRAPVVLHPACGRIVGCVKQLDDENAVCPLCRGVISPDSSFVQVNGLRELLETLNDSI